VSGRRARDVQPSADRSRRRRIGLAAELELPGVDREIESPALPRGEREAAEVEGLFGLSGQNPEGSAEQRRRSIERSEMTKVLYEKGDDRIARITINRPEARNAIDPETHELLCETWADFRDDDALDVAILTGAGDDAFCAGADLKTYIPPIIEDADPRRIREIVDLGFGGLTRGLHRIYKPIVAAVNGWALAGGLETALACDIRIASERAKFGSFEARRGYHHGDGGIVRLVNTCGTGVALQMLLTAEPIDAQRALQCNMVAKVVPHDSLMAEAEGVARQILRNSQVAVRSAKRTIFDVIGQPLDQQLRTEAWNAYTCADREETMARLESFYEKSDRGRAGEHGTEL
jgi:enoyl-CoA hydratase/carnithine racemase